MVIPVDRFLERINAQQAKGRVYVVAAGPFVKIGWSVDIRKRLDQMQTGCPFDLEVLVAVPVLITTETAAHAKWAHLRVRGEWFHRTTEIDEWVDWLKRRLEIEKAVRPRLIEWSQWRRPLPKARLRRLATTEDYLRRSRRNPITSIGTP